MVIDIWLNMFTCCSTFTQSEHIKIRNNFEKKTFLYLSHAPPTVSLPPTISCSSFLLSAQTSQLLLDSCCSLFTVFVHVHTETNRPPAARETHLQIYSTSIMVILVTWKKLDNSSYSSGQIFFFYQI